MQRSELTVDLGAIRRNVKRLLGELGGTELWAVVKANGYGHGAVDVAGAALGAGASGLCVATVAEAMELRAEFRDVRLVVLGPTSTSREIAVAREAGLELTVGDRVLQLTLMEANLLRYLVEHEGKAVSRKSMLEQVWGLHEDTDTRAIDNFVVRLRRYIEAEPARPKHLLTVRGVGYRFNADPQ